MLPHNHFLIAGLSITPVALALYPDKSLQNIGEWVVIGGFMSAAIDMDIITLVWLKSRKEQRLRLFRNPLEIYRQFKLFMDTITETGVLRTGLKTHLLISAAILQLCWYGAPAYFVPIAIAVMSHILSDIPNLRRLTA